jgi:hypothetical protein
LEGVVEGWTSASETRTLMAGDRLLMEDVTGKGHGARPLNGEALAVVTALAKIRATKGRKVRIDANETKYLILLQIRTSDLTKLKRGAFLKTAAKAPRNVRSFCGLHFAGCILRDVGFLKLLPLPRNTLTLRTRLLCLRP